MKFPISYDQFKKNPIKAILFLVLIAVVYLYVEKEAGTNEAGRRPEHKGRGAGGSGAAQG